MTAIRNLDLIGSWRVEDIGGRGVLDNVLPTIEFGADGSLSGSTGLNRFRGRYELVAGDLRCSPSGMTRMAGPPAVMDQETKFLAALSVPGTVRVEGPFVFIGEASHALRLLRSDDESAGAELVAVRGSVLYRERMLVPEAVVTVQLSDVSRMDTPAVVLAEQVITDALAPPFRFELSIDRGAIDERARLAVGARIESKGELVFVSDTVVPVPSDGMHGEVDIVVVRVSQR